MNWNPNDWTSLSNINSGNQFSNGDVPTASNINPIYNNVGYLYNQIFDSSTGINKRITDINTSINNLSTRITANTNSISSLSGRITSVTNTINNFLYYDYDDDHYVEIENTGNDITIIAVDTYDYYKSITHIYKDDLNMTVYGGQNLDQQIAYYGFGDIYNKYTNLNNTVTNINTKVNNLKADDIKETEATTTISSTGLYAVSFYTSSLSSVEQTVMLNIYDLSKKFSTIILVGTVASNLKVEVFYNNTNNKITVSPEMGTATITKCYKIAKI